MRGAAHVWAFQQFQQTAVTQHFSYGAQSRKYKIENCNREPVEV